MLSAPKKEGDAKYFDFRLYGFCEYVISDQFGNPIRKCDRPSVGVGTFINEKGDKIEMELCETHMFLVGSLSRNIM